MKIHFCRKTFLILFFTLFLNNAVKATEIRTPLACSSGQATYASWSESGTTNTGVGTFTNSDPYVSLAPNFTWVVTGDFQSADVDSSEIFTGSNNLEAIYGEADSASNLNVRVSSNGGKGSSPPIVSTATTTITFNSPTLSEGLAFVISDLDVDQVRISAKDNNGVNISTAIIDSWLIELFDTNEASNGLEEPFWDSNEPALIGVNAASTTWRTTTHSGDGTEAPAAWFQVNVSLSELTFELQPVSRNAEPSLHYYLATCLEQLSDLEVSKSSLNSSYTPGAFDTYTIQIKNNGPSGVAGVLINDLLPNGVNLINWSCSITQAGTGSIPTNCNILNGATNPINLTVDLANNGIIEIAVNVQYSTVASDYEAL